MKELHPVTSKNEVLVKNYLYIQIMRTIGLNLVQKFKMLIFT